MTKKSHRRRPSISVKGSTFKLLKAYCDELDIPKSELIERLTSDVPWPEGTGPNRPAARG